MARTKLEIKEIVGAIIPFAGTVAPDGWLLCDGSAVSRTTYERLFGIIGTVHGQGNGSTTFHLPDLRGRFIRGTDLGASRDPNAGARTAANTGGNTGDNVGSVQDDAFQRHRHRYSIQTLTGTSTSPSTFSQVSGSDTITRWRIPPTWNNPGSSGLVQPLVSLYLMQQRNSNGTPRVGNETRPLNVNMNYIIKV
jgi:microcystin-dependent protein